MAQIRLLGILLTEEVQQVMQIRLQNILHTDAVRLLLMAQIQHRDIPITEEAAHQALQLQQTDIVVLHQ